MDTSRCIKYVREQDCCAYLDLLLNEIEVDIENCDFENLDRYKQLLVIFKEIFPDEYVEDIENSLNILQEICDVCDTYDGIKTEILADLDDEDLAEDVAWKLAFWKL